MTLVVAILASAIICGLLGYCLGHDSQVYQTSYWRKLATEHDLTGLPNRRAMHLLGDDLINAWKLNGKRSPLTVAVIDLDGFKTVNDTYGHDTGDQLLTIFADTLRKFIRDPISNVEKLLPSHPHGDEFVVWARGCSKKLLQHRMRLIRWAYIKQVQLHLPHAIGIDCTFGVVGTDDIGGCDELPEAEIRRLLIDAADAKMNSAKEKHGKRRSA